MKQQLSKVLLIRLGLDKEWVSEWEVLERAMAKYSTRSLRVSQIEKYGYSVLLGPATRLLPENNPLRQSGASAKLWQSCRPTQRKCSGLGERDEEQERTETVEPWRFPVTTSSESCTFFILSEVAHE